MSRRKVRWFSPSLKSLILSGIFYIFAKLFLKSAEKMANGNKSKKKKKDFN
jgi:hypothetical protein